MIYSWTGSIVFPLILGKYQSSSVSTKLDPDNENRVSNQVAVFKFHYILRQWIHLFTARWKEFPKRVKIFYFFLLPRCSNIKLTTQTTTTTTTTTTPAATTTTTTVAVTCTLTCKTTNTKDIKIDILSPPPANRFGWLSELSRKKFAVKFFQFRPKSRITYYSHRFSTTTLN